VCDYFLQLNQEINQYTAYNCIMVVSAGVMLLGEFTLYVGYCNRIARH